MSRCMKALLDQATRGRAKRGAAGARRKRYVP